jgi:DNA-binding CsgD family transcriptional regulator
MVCDAELRVLAWNEAAEQLTGIPADDAVGWYGWQVLGAEDETGAVACHAGCSRARLLRDGLTGRQLEILGLIADGIPAKVISVRLGLSETTVRNHIRGILVRLGCHSQLEAVATARRAGLL